MPIRRLLSLALLLTVVDQVQAQAPVLQIDSLQHAPSVRGRHKSPYVAALASTAPMALGAGLFMGSGLVWSDDPRHTFQRATARTIAYTGLLMVVAGPSVGHAYARNSRATRGGLIVRGAVVATYLGARALDADLDGFERVGGVALGTVFVGSMLYDLGSAPASARRFNRMQGASVSVTPVLGPQSGAQLKVRM